MSEARPAALCSIHDVMPDTLDAVDDLLHLCAEGDLRAPALLVVPGLAWDTRDVERLRGWQESGCELIAHGWKHHTRPRRVYHRVHAALISRDVAEHLDLDDDAVVDLMRRSHAWFAAHGLDEPGTYIPPAWALGLPRARLRETPFRCVETLSGICLVGPPLRTRSLPLVGFEADTPLRARFLRVWNGYQRRSARHRGQPLRISIHPRDHYLHLAEDLRTMLRAPWRSLRYAELLP